MQAQIQMLVLYLLHIMPAASVLCSVWSYFSVSIHDVNIPTYLVMTNVLHGYIFLKKLSVVHTI